MMSSKKICSTIRRIICMDSRGRGNDNVFMTNLSKTVRGVSWVGLLRGSTRVVTFLKIAVVARILTPDQFGTYGIAVLVVAFLEIFTETGINMFFVQKEGELKKYINTAWVISIFRGFLIGIIILVSAPFIASFFNNPESLWLILLISLVPIIRGFINPASIRFQQEMNFRNEFWFRFVIFSFDAVVVIILAYLTRTPDSFIWGFIAGAMLEVLLSFVFLSPRPKFAFNKTQAQHIIHRGKWFTGFGIFEYLFRNGDDIIVGKFIGSGALGLYQMAYKLAILPITEVADVFGKVTLPVFVDMSSDKQRIKSGVLKTTGIVFALLLPILAIIFIMPEFIIRIVLGEQWLSVAPILQILVFFALIRTLINPALTMFIAMKRQEYVTITSGIGTITLFIIIFPLLQLYGLVGVAIATIIASAIQIPFVIYYSYKLLRT